MGIDSTLPGQVEKDGVKVLNNIGVSITTTAVAAVATKAMSGNPQAIGLLTGGSQVPALVTQLRQDGYKGVLFGNGGSDGTVDAAGAAADGYQYQAEWAPNLTSTASTTFLKYFNQVAAVYHTALPGHRRLQRGPLPGRGASQGRVRRPRHAPQGSAVSRVERIHRPRRHGGVRAMPATGRLYSPVVFIKFTGGKAESHRHRAVGSLIIG